MSIYKKIAAIQSKMIGIKESGKNPFLKNSYSLYVKDIMTALQPHLTEQKLAVSFQGYVDIDTNLQHLQLHIVDIENEAHSVTSTWVIPDVKDVQKLGSTITYYKRYALVAAFNLLVGHDDDDGQVTKTPPAKAKEEGITDEQLEEAIQLIKSGSVSKEQLLKLRGHKLTPSQKKKIESL